MVQEEELHRAGRIAAGVAGVERTLARLGMIDTDQPMAATPRESRRTGWVRASRTGIVHMSTALGEEVEADAEFQAHMAPLGITFWEEGAVIAFHGSWNRTTPTGYKVVRIPMHNGAPGPTQDFATGWLRADGSNWGRPVDVLTASDGSLFISDDSGGGIYRVFYADE